MSSAVYLSDGDLVEVLGQFNPSWGKGFAVAAPRGIKLYKLTLMIIKRFISQRDDFGKRRQNEEHWEWDPSVYDAVWRFQYYVSYYSGDNILCLFW